MKTKKPRNGRSNHGLATHHKIEMMADRLERITYFNAAECRALIHLHHRLEEKGCLDRSRMREILHVMFQITDDVMLDLAFKAFDRDADGCVDEIEFVEALSTMLRGTTEELSDWCYYIYDINSDGGLAREELSQCLKGCILPGYCVDQDEIEECERDIVEIVMRKLDVDNDGQISLWDFKKAVKRDPLLLVSVGPCLPPMRCCAAFLSLVTEKFRNYTGALGRRNPKRRARRIFSPTSLSPINEISEDPSDILQDFFI